MAVTLFRKRKIINNIIIRNGVANKKDEQETKPTTTPTQEINARLRYKMYGRRTIDKQN